MVIGEMERNSNDDEEVNSRPVVQGASPSGAVLLVRDENSQNSCPVESQVNDQSPLQREASKLLEIQKAVGFSFALQDNEVCEKLVADELRDRAQKVDRETVNVDQ
jgi:hypothetical protein